MGWEFILKCTSGVVFVSRGSTLNRLFVYIYRKRMISQVIRSMCFNVPWIAVGFCKILWLGFDNQSPTVPNCIMSSRLREFHWFFYFFDAFLFGITCIFTNYLIVMLLTIYNIIYLETFNLLRFWYFLNKWFWYSRESCIEITRISDIEWTLSILEIINFFVKCFSHWTFLMYLVLLF